MSWGIVNSATMNIGVQVSFRWQFSPDICPGIGLQVVLFFCFLRNFHTVLHSSCTSEIGKILEHCMNKNHHLILCYLIWTKWLDER